MIEILKSETEMSLSLRILPEVAVRLQNLHSELHAQFQNNSVSDFQVFYNKIFISK